MIIVTIEHVPGSEVSEVIGYVKGSTVQSKNIGRDILAALKNVVGGEIKEYTEMMDAARKIAIARMVKDAENQGADAIVGFRITSSAIMSSASEIVAYGTAVKLKQSN
ncbi:heavy metal-binding domain-containing protein [Priestia megaterium]|nr:heavy metal-binding domain-containing protein [Priestia megaterium]